VLISLVRQPRSVPVPLPFLAFCVRRQRRSGWCNQTHKDGTGRRHTARCQDPHIALLLRGVLGLRSSAYTQSQPDGGDNTDVHEHQRRHCLLPPAGQLLPMTSGALVALTLASVHMPQQAPDGVTTIDARP
jgi:hypothetical protein